MSKVDTIALAAAHLYTEARRVRAEDAAPAYAVGLALALYAEADKQIRASGPTSREPGCICGEGAFAFRKQACRAHDNPRHG